MRLPIFALLLALLQFALVPAVASTVQHPLTAGAADDDNYNDDDDALLQATFISISDLKAKVKDSLVDRGRSLKTSIKTALAKGARHVRHAARESVLGRKFEAFRGHIRQASRSVAGRALTGSVRSATSANHRWQRSTIRDLLAKAATRLGKTLAKHKANAATRRGVEAKVRKSEDSVVAHQLYKATTWLKKRFDELPTPKSWDKVASFASSFLKATSKFLKITAYTIDEENAIDDEVFNMLTALLDPAMSAMQLVSSEEFKIDNRTIACDDIPMRDLSEPLRKEVYLHRAGPMYAYDMMRERKWRDRLAADDPFTANILKDRCSPSNVQLLLESHPVLAAYVHETVPHLAIELDVYHSPALVAWWLNDITKGKPEPYLFSLYEFNDLVTTDQLKTMEQTVAAALCVGHTTLAANLAGLEIEDALRVLAHWGGIKDVDATGASKLKTEIAKLTTKLGEVLHDQFGISMATDASPFDMIHEMLNFVSHVNEKMFPESHRNRFVGLPVDTIFFEDSDGYERVAKVGKLAKILAQPKCVTFSSWLDRFHAAMTDGESGDESNLGNFQALKASATKVGQIADELKFVIDVKDTIASPTLVTAGIRGLEEAGVGLAGVGAFQAYKALQAAQFGPVNHVIHPYIFRFLPSEVERLCRLYETVQQPDNDLLIQFFNDASKKTIGVRLRNYLDARENLDVALLRRCKTALNFNLTVWDIEKSLNFVDTQHAINEINNDELLDGFAIGGPSDRWPDYDATKSILAPLGDVFKSALSGAADLAMGAVQGDIFESDVGFYYANGDDKGLNPFNTNFRLLFYLGVDDIAVTVTSKLEMAKHIWRNNDLTDVCLTLIPLFDSSRISDTNIPPSMVAFVRIVDIFASSDRTPVAPSETFGCVHPITYKSLRADAQQLFDKGLVPVAQRDVVGRFLTAGTDPKTDCWSAVRNGRACL